MKLLYPFLFLLFLNFKSTAQFVTINEVVSSNKYGILDEDGDPSDWIELYNNSSSIQNLSNYKLSDDNNTWIFPPVNIEPFSHLIIFASGKDRLSGELHTNFKISSDGELLTLYSDNQIVSSIYIPVLYEGMSYVSIPDGSSSYFISNNTSPNLSNNDVDQISFSHSDGFYSDSIQLSLQSALDNEIRYTTDGSDPTAESELWLGTKNFIHNESDNRLCNIPNTAEKQSDLSYKSWTLPKYNIDKCHIIKAASFVDSIRVSDIHVRTFFINISKDGLPIISIQMNEIDLFDDSIGIYVPGIYFDEENPEWTGNFFQSGKDWEKESYVTYLDNQGNLGFSQKLGLRIHGGKTRQATQKSLKFYAREEYGKDEIRFRLFDNRDVIRFKRFVLRTTMGSWNGNNLINDFLAHELAGNLDIDHQKYELAKVFLNGEYWGLYNITEKVDEHYLEYLTDINDDDIDIVGHWDSKLDSLYEIVQNGNYNDINQILDIPSFIDYFITQIYLGNRDWPSNNSRMWSNRFDRKWRYLFYDIDAGFGKPDVNMYNRIEEVEAKSSLVFKTLSKNPIFKDQFVKRLAELLETVFTTENVFNELQILTNMYRPYLQEHIDRWDYPKSINDWETDIDESIIDFVLERTCYLIDQTIEYFDLDEFDIICEVFKDENAKEDIDLIEIIPNICEDYFSISNKNFCDVTYALQVYNSIGQLVISSQSIEILAQESKEIRINLPNGYYFIKLSNISSSEDFKILVRNR